MVNYIILSIVIGVIFIASGLVIALVKKNMSPQVFWIVRVIVSLGAGFVAAGILGNLEIDGPILGITIKAGGPLAVTVITYVLNPPKLVRSSMNKSTVK